MILRSRRALGAVEKRHMLLNSAPLLQPGDWAGPVQLQASPWSESRRLCHRIWASEASRQWHRPRVARAERAELRVGGAQGLPLPSPLLGSPCR